jgi:hypothetical protein
MSQEPAPAERIIWVPDGSVCPICQGLGQQSKRFPAALCEHCQASVVDGDGNVVGIFNLHLWGGIKIRTLNGWVVSPEAERLPLYANGIECRAREHRLCGVVVQPLEAWKARDQI